MEIIQESEVDKGMHRYSKVVQSLKSEESQEVDAQKIEREDKCKEDSQMVQVNKENDHYKKESSEENSNSLRLQISYKDSSPHQRLVEKERNSS